MRTQIDKANPVGHLPAVLTAGDWMLTFQAGDADGWPHRMPDAPWCASVEGDSWRLWCCPNDERWMGAPLLATRQHAWQVWLLGELYGEEQPEHFLAEWLASDRDGARLNGHFLLMGWNAQLRQWHVWTDRFGTMHAYWATNGRRTAIGTFCPAVAEAVACRELDWIGLTSFFTFGFFAQDRTHFEGIRVLRPASHYIFDEVGRLCHQERYWTWHYCPDERRSYDETVEMFAGLLRQVMAEHIQGGRVALPISGGLDSRSTVAAIDTAKAVGSLWPYSYGYSDDSVETEIARNVANARGLPLTSFTIQPYLFERLELITSSIEGFGNVTQCRQASVLEEIDRHADYVVAAHWGDVWLDDMGLAADRGEALTVEAVLCHALHKMEKQGREWLLHHLCRVRLGSVTPEALAREIVECELAAVQHIADADFRVKALKTEQWSWRGTLTGERMFQPAVFPRLPFYDTRLADFFCTVPSAFVAGRRLQIDFLKRYAPELARVKWQVYDANLYSYRYFDSFLLPQRALKKVRYWLRRQRVIERNWEVQFLNEAGRQGLQRWLLQPGLRLHEFVAPAKVAHLVDAFYADPWAESRGFTLGMLLTFSAWIEQYG